MKKLIYMAIFAVFASLSITACTEEQVEPVGTFDNGGGAGSERTNP